MTTRPKNPALWISALVVVAGIGGCLEVSIGNFFSLNLRAASAEGRYAAECLSTEPDCVWSGWRSGAQLAQVCPSVRCLKEFSYRRGYAVTRNGDAVIAVGVGAYDNMVDDEWRGHDGVALHCVDQTQVPGPLRALILRQDFGHPQTTRSDDPRCAPAVVRRELPDAAALRPSTDFKMPSVVPTP